MHPAADHGIDDRRFGIIKQRANGRALRVLIPPDIESVRSLEDIQRSPGNLLALQGSNGSKRKLQQRGLSNQAIADFMHKITTGLANQLFNVPLDMVIEQRLHDRYDFLHPSQVASLHATQLENQQALTDETLREIVPPRIYQANIAMNCAYALFTDALFNGATAYATPYRKSRLSATGRKLFHVWQKSIPKFEPGDEYDLVDQFARILKLEEWYEWRLDDAGDSRST